MPRKFNTQKKLHIKKGDTVEVIAGNEKGNRGKVLYVEPENQRIIVEGINMTVRHMKPSQQNQQGGRVQQEGPIHISNVLVVDPNSDEATRIGRKRVEEEGKGRWVRYAKINGELIDK